MRESSSAAVQSADLVLFDPERAWKIAEKDFRSKSKNSPFDGRPAQGRVLDAGCGVGAMLDVARRERDQREGDRRVRDLERQMGALRWARRLLGA